MQAQGDPVEGLQEVDVVDGETVAASLIREQ